MITAVKIPTLRGVIDRRLLVNYRVDPDAIAAVLPPPFRPKLLRGHAIGSICLIRLKDLRPRFVPAWAGLRSENAAHRIAVEWDEGGRAREGVFIPRRDTNSRLTGAVGGRLFPGEHHVAHFDVREEGDHVRIAMDSLDGTAHVRVAGRLASTLPSSSIFESLNEVSAFIERGSVGYSATQDNGRFDGLELRTRTWKVTPFDVREIASSFFEDARSFPLGKATFDCALVMRAIEHEWHACAPICCAA
jgi:hypothetical protein